MKMISNELKNIINSAKKVALHDDYPQIVFIANDGGYGFSRLFNGLNLFDVQEENILGIVDTYYNKYGCLDIRVYSQTKDAIRVKEYLEIYNVII